MGSQPLLHHDEESLYFNILRSNSFKMTFKRRVISSDDWFGTKRIDIFAYAFEGRTVFAPSPIYPPQIPFTSRDGLMDVLSFVEYPSHQKHHPHLGLFYSSRLKGAFDISFLSSSLTTKTFL